MAQLLPILVAAPSSRRFVPMLRLPLLGLALSFSAGAQSMLPVNPATSELPVGTAGPVKASTSPHRADITYTGTELRIVATNSSLNQILREVGRLTGMKITGGVSEDRVFGTYGPAPRL